MRILGATIYALGIPFVESFKHSTQARSFSDAVVVRLVDEEGNVGYGEGLPRPYVTGESVESMVAFLETRLWPAIAGRPVPMIEQPDETEAFEAFLPDLEAPGVVAPHAARAAMELALLDVSLKRQGRSLAHLLPPVRAQLTYSGVITAGSVEKAVQHARQMKLVGLQSIKIKVGLADDVERVRAVREVFGPGASLRLDANGAWSLEEAIAALEALAPFDIAAVEQPMPRGAIGDWAALRRASPIPLMVDESLVTMADAEALIANEATDYFNLRISKCGGVLRARRMGRRALAAGLRLQVGSQVGETAIGSAAGRHLAASLPELDFLEGSFGTLLLTEDISLEPVKFGHRGLAPRLTGPGLGVRVADDRLEKYARRKVALTADEVRA
ncbi:MAG: mandelate racemase/muconate lactonizing enzyme family protein [Candidatus Sericytochromatia bacterium]